VRTARARVVSTLAVVVVAAALALVAFLQNRAVVHEVAWPGLDIQYRELAGAQTILDQGYGPDSAYVSERAWYNPMAIWVVAGLSRLSGMAAPLVIARSGPYINFLAPVAFFAMVAVLFDQFAALAAAAAFIFVVGTEFPFTYSASYSPWFAPENFGQAWMYLSIAAASLAFGRGRSLAWAIAGGALLGVTFLTHVAPALLCGVVWVVLAALESRRSEDRSQQAVRLATALGSAFVVSLPFTTQILGHYHLAIVNPFPSQSPSDLLDFNELPALARQLATVPVALAVLALGFRGVFRRDRGTEVMLALLGAVLLFLGIFFARQLLTKLGANVPAVVPGFHFFFYLMAVVSVGVGLALRDIGAAMGAWMKRRDAAHAAGPAGALVTCGLVVLLVMVSFPHYQARIDFTDLRREVLETSERFPSEVVDWIRAHSIPDDVFLCTDDASLYIVAPAGRKVVATNRYFSNPYVDWAGRDADRRQMFERLEQSDVEGFRAVARKYGVRFVLVSADRSDGWLRASGMRVSDLPAIDPTALGMLPGFSLAFRSKRFGIVAIGDGPEAAGFRASTGSVRRVPN
jgi:hypothetical protein